MSDPENSDYEEASDIDFGQLSSSDFDRVRRSLNDKCSAVNAFLLSCRESVEKRRLIGSTLTDLMAAFDQVSTAYLQLSASFKTASYVKRTIAMTVKSQVIAALKELPPPTAAPGVGQSYAEKASISLKTDPRKVKVSNGPTVIVPSTVSVVIGPKADEQHKFGSSEATRAAVMNVVKPGDINLKVNKLINSHNKSMRIIAEDIYINKLKSSPNLAAAGLEIKEREKLNPRMVVRGVPKDMTSPDLLSNIRSLNFAGDLPADGIKIVYRYPPRANNSLASVVIETSSDVRKKLLSQGRIYLPWQSCKVEDHLRVLQCYRCQSFGHLAKSCTSNAVCGNCAGAHETSSCKNGSGTFKCHNCVLSKSTNLDHKAFDVSKCPIIKRKLTEKARNICY